jgi:hypothetical protein
MQSKLAQNSLDMDPLSSSPRIARKPKLESFHPVAAKNDYYLSIMLKSA